MKGSLSIVVAGVLLAGSAWAAPRTPMPATLARDDWGVPPPGESRIVPLTAEQAMGERAALERIHDETILAGASNARRQDKVLLESLLRRLLTDGTIREKAEYANSIGKSYSIPDRLTMASAKAGFRPAFDGTIRCRATRCKRFVPEQTCNDRLVCNLVCAGVVGGVAGAAGGVAGGVVGAIGGAECSRVCQIIQECRTVQVCYEYVLEGPGCF